MSEDDSGRGMSREALRDELMTLLVAGQETSAILLAWTCAYLAHHPAVQARAAEEVLQVPPVLLLLNARLFPDQDFFPIRDGEKVKVGKFHARVCSLRS